MTQLLKGTSVSLLLGMLVVAQALSKEAVAPAQNETVVATLQKEQVSEFEAYVKVKELRREEVVVVSRMTLEKQTELKGFMDEMSKEFGIAADKSYTFEKGTKSLFVLSTNQVDKAGKPVRTLVKKIKTDTEAQYLARLMVARRLTEQQLIVLQQLKDEKSKEYGLVDAKLRQTFKLDPQGTYRLDEKTGQVVRLTAPAQEQAPAPKDRAAADSKKNNK